MVHPQVLKNCGINNKKFQEHVLRMQIVKENEYREIAFSDPAPHTVLLFERGTMDGHAYMEPHEFHAMIKQMNYSIIHLRDERYDGIFHLVTAAIGAEAHYTTKNNPARTETPKEAAARDIKTRDAWIGHPHLRIIDNSTPFEAKMNRLAFAIERLVGLPEPLEIENKYLVRRPNLNQLVKECGAVPIAIEQIYIDKEKKRARIRKRGQGKSFIYYCTVKQNIGRGVAAEYEDRISRMMYDYLLKNHRDLSRDIIRKTRYCFLWENQYFELDVFATPTSASKLTLMEIELEEVNQNVVLPPFIDIIKDVTGNSRYANSSIAKGKKI
jgi:CYTH domain-containing protein